MQIVATHYAVADYCAEIQSGKLTINRKYQRSDKVWPPAAKSFFVETILLGYPVPKLSLYQITDVKTKKTRKEIVDGQQRSKTLLDFFGDEFRLSRTLETQEVAGKKFSQLDERYRRAFLEYSLPCDLFVATTEAEIREVFRRINSYTVPLNPEEHRHAIYQGEFKWFAYYLSKEFSEHFLQMGLFGPKQLVRLADTKLLAEMAHAMLLGINTTKKPQLDKLYKDKDKSFPEHAEFEKRMRAAFMKIYSWVELHNGPLMKPHIIYALALAIMHQKKPLETLQENYESSKLKKLDDEVVVANLSVLGEQLSLPAEEQDADYEDFISSCSSKTNVREQRALRFEWFCEALEPELM